MKAYASLEKEVLVIQVTIIAGSREEIRQDMKQQLGARYVWFDDERGTIHDPFHGPIKRLGPNGYINPEDN